MDPDADLSHPVVSKPPPQSNSGRRKDRRLVSREVALPNSSRRSNARKSRNSSDGGGAACRADGVVGATHSSSSNNRSNKLSSTSSSSSKKQSSSSSSAHRSLTASSSDRRHHRSSRHSSSGARSSVRDEEHHNQHRSSHSRHSSSRSSRHHDHNHRDDNKRRSDDKQSSSKSKSSSSSKDIVEVSKKTSQHNNTKPRVSSSITSSSSKYKHYTKNEKADNNNNTYQVFYDEHGRKIKVPTTTTSSTPTIIKAASASVAPTPSEMIGEACGYHSSDFDTDSDTPDHDQHDDNRSSDSSSGIDGASDFEEDQEEEYNSDYIDGASELDDDDEEVDDEDIVEYDEGVEDYIVIDNDGVDHDGEESIDRSEYDDTDTTNSDFEEEMEEYGDNDDNTFSKEHQSVATRSNSPELNDTRRQLQPLKSDMELIARNFYGDEIAILHADPPSNKSIDNRYDIMDPNEDEGATLRLNRPPTPESDKCNDIGDNFSQMSVRGRDPPEEGRGCDPPFVPGGTGASSSKRLEPRLRKSAQQQQEQAKEKKKPAIRGILKKKEGAAPPPLAYFGRTSQSTSEHNSDSDDVEDSINDSGSDPDFSEIKPSKQENEDDDSAILSLFEDTSVSTAKSGLRSGRFAEANAAAAAAAASNLETIDDGDSNSDDEHDHVYSANASTEVRKRSNSADFNTSFPTLLGDDENQFDRNKSHFMRTSDLGLTQDTIFAEQFLDNPDSKPEPHYHHPSPHPPPGIQFNCDENWISVDDGNGGHSPIAPQAVDALVATGYRTACDPMMWTPTSKTRKFMTDAGLRFDDVPTPAPPEEEGGRADSSCLVWSGKFPHKHYGHDLPVIRSQGVVNMSPEELVDLLMDSTRVKSYNVSSIGRKDELMLSDGTDLDTCPFSGQRKKKLTGVVIQGAKIVNGAAVGFAEESDEQSDYEEEEEVTEMEFDDDGRQSVRTFTTLTSPMERRKSLFVGVTKLVRSTNKVPMRKNLEYVTLLHCQALTDDQGGNGYIIVGRAVTPAEDAGRGNKDVQRAEILLNVHIIRRLREKNSKYDKRKRISSSDRAKTAQMRNRCLMINVVHVKSPIIPNMLAKKVSLSAASNFITDIRALTEE
mmetsp:Transcript_36596/g.74703  ORF Transcript_36596/g.74703 Transcript_36596/m.74703 type:complete len:1104 (+) Transcript_36596:180-3491(+)